MVPPRLALRTFGFQPNTLLVTLKNHNLILQSVVPEGFEPTLYRFLADFLCRWDTEPYEGFLSPYSGSDRIRTCDSYYYTRVPVERLKPDSATLPKYYKSILQYYYNAEDKGIEPSLPFKGRTVFKTAPTNQYSAILQNFY